MRLSKVALEDYKVTAKVIQDAKALCNNGGIRKAQETSMDTNMVVLTAKSVDSFQFVDHPCLVLDLSCDRLDYRCDCPDFRKYGCFCQHCAALALEFGAMVKKGEEPPIPDLKTKLEAEVPPVEETTEEEPSEEDGDDSFYGLKDFSYQYCNSRYALYPNEAHPRIPLERFKQVFGDNMRARSLYQQEGEWGGSCFGFSSSSSMLAVEDGDYECSDFMLEYLWPCQIRLTDRNEKLGFTLHEILEAMQIMQMASGIMAPRTKHLFNVRCMEMLCQRVRAFQEGTGLPVVMCVWGSIGGHAVLPYRVETISPTEDRLHIYDPNWPMKVRYAYFTKNQYGEYKNWRFPMGTVDFSSTDGGRLAFDDYADYLAVWQNRGESLARCTMTLKPGAVVAQTDGTVLARINGNGAICYAENVFQMMLVDTRDRAGTVMLDLPQDTYIVRSEIQEPVSIRCTGIDYDIVLATEAQEAIVAVIDDQKIASAMVNIPNKTYSIQVNMLRDGEDYSVKLEGVSGAQGVYLRYHNGAMHSKAFEESSMKLFINDQAVEDPLNALVWDNNENAIPEELLLEKTNTDKKDETLT